MRLVSSSHFEVYQDLKTKTHPRSRFCPAISGFLSIGDFVIIPLCPDVCSLKIKNKDPKAMKAVKELRGSTMFGQVMNLYQGGDADDDIVLLDLNVYKRRDLLPINLGRFNSAIPQERVLVQTELVLNGCNMSDVAGAVMVIHADQHDLLMQGLLNVYFIESHYTTTSQLYSPKTQSQHFRSSSDLYRSKHPGFVSHPEMQYSALVKISDAVCKMMCRVAASQPRTNRVHLDMLPCVWILIKTFLLAGVNNQSVPMYHDKKVKAQSIKRGIFVTEDKRIQLATVERQVEDHHYFDRIIAYCREHVIICQLVFGISFGIGARLRHPKTETKLAKAKGKRPRKATPLTTNLPVADPVPTPVSKPKVSTTPVTTDTRVNTLTQLPTAAKVTKDNKKLADFVTRGLEGVTLLYDWAAHRLTVRVGYSTPLMSDDKECKNLFAVFQSLVADFSSDDEDQQDTFPEKGKHLFYKGEMHTVMHYDGGAFVKVAPSQQLSDTFMLSQDVCRSLIGTFYDELCGSVDSQSSPVNLHNLASDSD